MDGLVASVDRVVDGVVHRALDVRPLELVPRALPRDVAVGDAGVTLDGAETGVSWIQTLLEMFQQTLMITEAYEKYSSGQDPSSPRVHDDPSCDQMMMCGSSSLFLVSQHSLLLLLSLGNTGGGGTG